MAEPKKKVTIAPDEDDDEKITSQEDDDESGDTTKKNKEDAGDDENADDSDEEDDAQIVPPVRKSVAQHIITRQKNKIEKLQSKQDQDDSDEEDEADPDADLEADDKKARKTIGQEVQKQITPLIKSLASNADENELKELFATEPEAKKYEKRIRTYMANEGWKAIPPSAIYHHLAFGKAAESTTQKKAAADLETRQSRGAGSGRRPTKPAGDIPSIEDMENMDDASFEKLQHKARIGKFKKQDE